MTSKFISHYTWNHAELLMIITMNYTYWPNQKVEVSIFSVWYNRGVLAIEPAKRSKWPPISKPPQWKVWLHLSSHICVILQHKIEREWILDLLVNSLKDKHCFELCDHQKIIHVLLGFFNSPLCDETAEVRWCFSWNYNS